MHDGGMLVQRGHRMYGLAHSMFIRIMCTLDWRMLREQVAQLRVQRAKHDVR